MRSITISRLPRHIQSGRNLQMAGASICNHCGLAVADEFRDSHNGRTAWWDATMSVPNRFCNDCGAQVQTVNVEIRNSQTGDGERVQVRGVIIVINHKKIKSLGIKPERVRALINEIKSQSADIDAFKGKLRHSMRRKW